MSLEQFDSVYLRRASVANLIEQGVVDNRVLEQLIVDGFGIGDEAVLWDFKSELPVMPNVKINDHLKQQYDFKFSQIVKDAVSFHNSYGGYLISGVDDQTRAIVGCPNEFDASDLNKRIQGATGASVETTFRLLTWTDRGGVEKNLGLLFIPKRDEGKLPVQFKKSATANEAGKRAYEQNDFYFRERDACRPAVSAEELEFLYGTRNISYTQAISFIENNLPPRDADLERLIGRDEVLADLWKWLADTFSPVKILSGLGGVGKTSIAYTFSERLIYRTAVHIDRLV